MQSPAIHSQVNFMGTFTKRQQPMLPKLRAHCKWQYHGSKQETVACYQDTTTSSGFLINDYDLRVRRTVDNIFNRYDKHIKNNVPSNIFPACAELFLCTMIKNASLPNTRLENLFNITYRPSTPKIAHHRKCFFIAITASTHQPSCTI